MMEAQCRFYYFFHSCRGGEESLRINLVGAFLHIVTSFVRYDYADKKRQSKTAYLELRELRKGVQYVEVGI